LSQKLKINSNNLLDFLQKHRKLYLCKGLAPLQGWGKKTFARIILVRRVRVVKYKKITLFFLPQQGCILVAKIALRFFPLCVKAKYEKK
jgi:hypothetical protein